MLTLALRKSAHNTHTQSVSVQVLILLMLVDGLNFKPVNRFIHVTSANYRPAVKCHSVSRQNHHLQLPLQRLERGLGHLFSQLKKTFFSKDLKRKVLIADTDYICGILAHECLKNQPPPGRQEHLTGQGLNWNKSLSLPHKPPSLPSPWGTFSLCCAVLRYTISLSSAKHGMGRSKILEDKLA